MILAERGASADASRSLPERIAALVPDDAIGPARQVTALARALQRAGIGAAGPPRDALTTSKRPACGTASWKTAGLSTGAWP